MMFIMTTIRFVIPDGPMNASVTMRELFPGFRTADAAVAKGEAAIVSFPEDAAFLPYDTC